MNPVELGGALLQQAQQAQQADSVPSCGEPRIFKQRYGYHKLQVASLRVPSRGRWFQSSLPVARLWAIYFAWQFSCTWDVKSYVLIPHISDQHRIWECFSCLYGFYGELGCMWLWLVGVFVDKRKKCRGSSQVVVLVPALRGWLPEERLPGKCCTASLQLGDALLSKAK